MKKRLVITMMLAGGIALAASVTMTGFGRVVTATATPAVITVPDSTYGWTASIAVISGETVYVQKNSTTNTFVLTNAIPIAVGSSFTFRNTYDEGVGWRLFNLTYATVSGTGVCHVAFD